MTFDKILRVLLMIESMMFDDRVNDFYYLDEAIQRLKNKLMIYCVDMQAWSIIYFSIVMFNCTMNKSSGCVNVFTVQWR
jgi:hypothetical protein